MQKPVYQTLEEMVVLTRKFPISSIRRHKKHLKCLFRVTDPLQETFRSFFSEKIDDENDTRILSTGKPTDDTWKRGRYIPDKLKSYFLPPLDRVISKFSGKHHT